MLVLGNLEIEDGELVDVSPDLSQDLYEPSPSLDLLSTQFWTIISGVDSETPVRVSTDWSYLLTASNEEINEYFDAYIEEFDDPSEHKGVFGEEGAQTFPDVVIAHGNSSVLVTKLKQRGYTFSKLVVIDQFSVEHEVGKPASEVGGELMAFYLRVFKGNHLVSEDSKQEGETYLEFYVREDAYKLDSLRALNYAQKFETAADIGTLELRTYQEGWVRVHDITRLGMDGSAARRVSEIVGKVLGDVLKID